MDSKNLCGGVRRRGALFAALLAFVITLAVMLPASATQSETTRLRIWMQWDRNSGDVLQAVLEHLFDGSSRWEWLPAGSLPTSLDAEWDSSHEIALDSGYSGRVIARWSRTRDAAELGFRIKGRADVLPRNRWLERESEDRWYRTSWFQIRRPHHRNVSRVDKQRALAIALFQYGANLRYSHNDYRACPSLTHRHFTPRRGVYTHFGNLCGNNSSNHEAVWGYEGGHSGWDALRSGNGHAFFALAAGRVKCVNRTDGEIAIVDPTGHLVRYLHAERIDVRMNAHVRVGDQLGIQGRKGFATGNHVHVEVRYPARPAGHGYCTDSKGAEHSYSIDPVDYLYDTWLGD